MSASSAVQLDWPWKYSAPRDPTYTPVDPVRSSAGAMFASSIARHTSSSSNRCCGSSCVASRGEMLKKRASNLSTSSTKPPSRMYIFPGAPGSGS
ncbi:MAG: hypothetical protein R3F34_16230 [Planctomycetota bacterium]